ncbi:hypothetical protein CNMCM5793_007671 [Aspergillus hiratsukae]|uniref:Endonuclease/exonuclease/phosphatase domain-containing protein n=1 Tax=Aspergillus hiratsukae TaxID=1194566 RepID=A0A8H6UK62_9EURO|nr:hypothetical protein CNMCM5793_007671 [Aspergillus hiratsukae]
MTLLSAHRDTATYDVLAIQEPAHNPRMHATYCETNSPFRPLYPTNRHTRACFLINKKWPSHCWDVEFFTDIAVLTIRLPARALTIINVYNPPTGPHVYNPDSPILRLPELLRREGEHILLGDFNLHHPLWSAPNGARTSRMAEDLLGTTGAAGLVLATPPGLVTWGRNDASSSTSTIDLIFLSESLSQHVLLCDVQEALHHGSDHRPVATWLALPDSQQANPVKPRRLWKLADKELVRAGSEHLTIPQHLSSHQQIDEYAEYLRDFILALAETSTPKAKDREEGAPRCAWWTREVEDRVRDERRARRLGRPAEEVNRLTERKKAAIHNAKRETWRAAVHGAKDGEKGIWNLVRWAKDRSHLPPELPKVPKLKRGPGLPAAETFKEKATVFHNQFFPPEPVAEAETPLTRIMEIESAPRVSEEMVRAALGNMAPNKAPGIDGIPAGFLQAMGDPLIKALQVLTQACWDWERAIVKRSLGDQLPS